jgi:hypothetical protein
VGYEFAFVNFDDQIFKLDRFSEVSLSKKLDTDFDSIGFPVVIKEWDFNQITHATNTIFSLFDFRSNQINKVINKELLGEKCEYITNHVKSNYTENLCYLATNHSVFGFDLRFPKQPLLQWTHQLCLPPTMIKNCDFAGNEIICLSSNMIGDYKIFNKVHDKNSISRLNLRPYNITKCKELCKKDYEFNKSANFENRLQKDITGITVLNENDTKLHVFTQNKCNDVFHTIVFSNVGDVKLQSNHNLYRSSSCHEKYEELIAHNAITHQYKYFVTKYKSLKPLIQHLKSSSDVFNLIKPISSKKTDLNISSNFVNNVSWKVNISDLFNCKDILSSDLLFLWNIELEIEKKEDHNTAELKVSNWIHSSTLLKYEDKFDDIEKQKELPQSESSEKNYNQSQKQISTAKSIYNKGF